MSAAQMHGLLPDSSRVLGFCEGCSQQAPGQLRASGRALMDLSGLPRPGMQVVLAINLAI